MSEEARITWVAISSCLETGAWEEVVLVAQQLCSRRIAGVF